MRYQNASLRYQARRELLARLRGPGSGERSRAVLTVLMGVRSPRLLSAVFYRRLKLTDALQASFDGWLVCLNGQQKEQMHTSIMRYVPSLIT